MFRDWLSPFVLPAAPDAALPLDVDKFVDDDSDPDAPETSARPVTTTTPIPRPTAGASRVGRRVEREPLALPAPGERAGRTRDRPENRRGRAEYASARKFDADSARISGQRICINLLGHRLFVGIWTPFLKVVYYFD